MKFLPLSLALASGLLLGACASTHPTPVLHAPSVAPVEQAVTRVEQHVQGAKGAAQKLADECAQKNAGWQDAYNQLMDELTQAQLSATIAQEQLADLKVESQKFAQDATNEISFEKTKADKQEARATKAVAQYHRSKVYGASEAFALGLILASVVGFRLIPGPYKFYSLAAAPLAATAFYLLL